MSCLFQAQVSTTRLSLPTNVTQQQTTTRLVAAPQATVLTSGARISTVQQQPVSSARLVSTTQTGGNPATAAAAAAAAAASLGRLSVTVANAAQVTSANILGQTRISTLSLHPLVAVANSAQGRSLQAQGAKVITQPAQGKVVDI